MDAGKLRDRVTLRALQQGQDTTGQPAQAWVAVATVWGDVQHLTGKQTMLTDRDVSVVQASIRVRFRADVSAGMSATVRGVPYDIRAVLPHGREWLDLVCETGASHG